MIPRLGPPAALVPPGCSRQNRTIIAQRKEVCSRSTIPVLEGKRSMRIGLMIGPERGRYRTKVERLQADARWAESAGLATVWIPQIPDEFDALTAAVLVGTETSRIEIGTAVVPVQPRHPIALAQQILSVQAVCEGRL